MAKMPRRERLLKEAALARWKSKLQDYYKEWEEAGAICCPGCMFPEFDNAVLKIDRIEAELLRDGVSDG